MSRMTDYMENALSDTMHGTGTISLKYRDSFNLAAAVVLSAALRDRVRAALWACVASWPARLLLDSLRC